MDKLTELTVKQYLEKLASKEPTPGGGSALALVAATATSLLSMAAKISLARYGKDPQGNKNKILLLESKLSSIENHLETFSDLVTEDAKAFSQYMTALRMPRDTALDKAMRERALRDASIACATVCKTFGYTVLDVCLNAPLIWGCATESIRIDAAVAEELLVAVCHQVADNLLANAKLVSESYTVSVQDLYTKLRTISCQCSSNI